MWSHILFIYGEIGGGAVMQGILGDFMSASAWQFVVNALLLFAMPLAYFGLKSRLETGIKDEFNKETLRMTFELNKIEEKFKSELRLKENEFEMVINGVLSGANRRQSLLDERRLKAVENVWASVLRLTPYKSLSASIAAFDLRAVALKANEPAMKQFLQILLGAIQEDEKIRMYGLEERPFLSLPAWALFSAYTVLLTGNYAVVKALEAGFTDVDKLLNVTLFKNILKAALPHHAEKIETTEALNSYYSFVDELEEALIFELRKMLEGSEIDQAETIRASKILQMVNLVAPDTKPSHS